MYKRQPGATEPRYYDMLDQPIEDLGNPFQHKYANDSWNSFSQSYSNEQRSDRHFKKAAEARASETSFAEASGRSSMEQVTSPPLSSFSVLLRDADGFEADPDFASFSNEAAAESGTSTILENSMENRATRDAMELVRFKLSQTGMSSSMAISSEASGIPARQLEDSVTSGAHKRLIPECPSMSNSDDDNMGTSFCGASTLNSLLKASTPSDNDRGFRKKSREKMRRREVNIKFEIIINLLGLSSRIRKKNVLNEAASAITGLKRECNQLRRDRDCLQQELNKMATYLQYMDCHT